MSTAETISRRTFLAGTGSLVLGVGLVGRTKLVKADDALASDALFAPDAFVRIAPDDTVTVVIKHMEMGQGPYTGLATLVAEELDADWSQMRAVSAPADDAKYGHTQWKRQGTGGSSSIANSFYQMRNAGAAARQMLVEAAAGAWDVPAGEIRVERGELSHSGSNRRGRFGAFVAQAAKRPLPQNPRLKKPAEFKLIGHELPRLDTRAKSDGSAVFTIDHFRDDMLTVMIERPPVFGARVTSFDAKDALATPGVVAVREVPQGVAVYAGDTWSAIQGRESLRVEWNESAAEKRSTEELFALFREAATKPGLPAAVRGDAATAVAGARETSNVFVAEAEYAFPYLAHAPMEPLDALLERDGDKVRVTTASQGPGRDHPAIAEVLGLPLDRVEFDVQMAGGSFGRRSQHDASLAREAAHVFKAQPGDAKTRRPTKLVQTREDDIRGGYYRPMVVHRMTGAMTKSGQLVGWDQTIAAQSYSKGTPREKFFKDGIDRAVVEGASNLSYATQNLRVTQHLVDVGVPVLWWRSVGHTHTGFAVEAFIDELLEGAGQDPVAGRLALLTDKPRHRGVLQRAAELADWGRKPAKGRAFGVAVHESFNSFVAQIVEIETAAAPVPHPRVKRVWCAVDCGIAVNPGVIRAQMEGGIGFGLGAALYSEIHLDRGGRVRESNFDAYRNLRFGEMPEIEVAIIASDEDPTGVGEPGVPPIAPAVANAWRRLSGQRVSQLPFVRTA